MKISGNKKTENEAVYTAVEFAGRPLLFGTSSELILAAFAERKLKEATLAEAKKIVKQFQERKVI